MTSLTKQSCGGSVRLVYISADHFEARLQQHSSPCCLPVKKDRQTIDTSVLPKTKALANSLRTGFDTRLRLKGPARMARKGIGKTYFGPDPTNAAGQARRGGRTNQFKLGLRPQVRAQSPPSDEGCGPDWRWRVFGARDGGAYCRASTSAGRDVEGDARDLGLGDAVSVSATQRGAVRALCRVEVAICS